MPNSGAMVAALPSKADMRRLAVEGGLEPDDLHVTVRFMGEAADLSDREVRDAHVRAAQVSASLTPFQAEASGWARFDPAGEDALVLLMQGAQLLEVRERLQVRDEGSARFPVWVPHLTLGYKMPDHDVATERLGPVRIDRLVVAVGTDRKEYPFRTSVARLSALMGIRRLGADNVSGVSRSADVHLH